MHESPAKLFEEHIDFGVYNARSVRRDAKIGAFKLDIGLIHQQEQHTFTRKWLMLSNPKEPSAGVKGYLKISVSVLGQGDEAPDEGDDHDDKNENVESNMLRPVGVESEPIDLLFKAFIGLDMPRADVSLRTGIRLLDKITRQADKEYCDPYIKIQFAGVSRKTNVESNTYSPVWMQELHLPALLPSMCDDLTIQALDSDLGFFSSILMMYSAQFSCLLVVFLTLLAQELDFYRVLDLHSSTSMERRVNSRCYLGTTLKI